MSFLDIINIVIVLCGDDETDVSEYLETWTRALDDRGMRISRPKTLQENYRKTTVVVRPCEEHERGAHSEMNATC